MERMVERQSLTSVRPVCDAILNSGGRSHSVRKVVVQERRKFVRLGLEQLLAADGELDVVASVEDATTLPDLVGSTGADVVLCEIAAVRAAPDLVPAVRAVAPTVRLVGLHPGRSTDIERRLANCGLDALVSYGSGVRSITDAALGRPLRNAPAADRRRLPLRSALTPREVDILRSLAAGMTAAGCAEALGVSPKTVDNHKQRIFTKLGVQNQAHAVALAHRMGLLGPRSSAAVSG